jgi:serine O-acetyltransferase
VLDEEDRLMSCFGPLAVYKASRWICRRRVPLLPGMLDYLNRMVFCCWLPHTARIGAGLKLGYGGLGVVVHQDSTIGNNVQIDHHVTIGGNAVDFGVPTVGDDVYVGVGACVLGPVTVGSGSVIGAGSVVLKDIPAGSVAVGAPARVVKQNITIQDHLYHLRRAPTAKHDTKEP